MVFGVFDGHGGQEVAQFVKENFTKNLTSNKHFINGQYENALRESVMAVDKLVSQEEYAQDTGSTSCIVLITPT